MSDDSTIFRFGSLGTVLCENSECAANLKKLPEDSFSWKPEIPHTGYSVRIESVDGLTVIYQPATVEPAIVEKYRLNLKPPTGSVMLYEKSLDGHLTRFVYSGIEFAVFHRFVLPPNYKQKIVIDHQYLNPRCS